MAFLIIFFGFFQTTGDISNVFPLSVPFFHGGCYGERFPQRGDINPVFICSYRAQVSSHLFGIVAFLRNAANGNRHSFFYRALHSYGMLLTAFRRNATPGRNESNPQYPVFRGNAPYDHRSVESLIIHKMAILCVSRPDVTPNHVALDSFPDSDKFRVWKNFWNAATKFAGVSQSKN